MVFDRFDHNTTLTAYEARYGDQSHIIVITSMVLSRQANQQRQMPLADPDTEQVRVISSS
jgi:hypothetical protein